MIDVETDGTLACRLYHGRGPGVLVGAIYMWAWVRRHITGVEQDGANDIPLFLIYKTLVPSPPCMYDCSDTPGPPTPMLNLRADVYTYCDIKSTSTVLRSKSS